MSAMERLKAYRSPAAIARMLGYSLGYFAKRSRRERNLSTLFMVLSKQPMLRIQGNSGH